jgi:hypothetical protein
MKIISEEFKLHEGTDLELKLGEVIFLKGQKDNIELQNS